MRFATERTAKEVGDVLQFTARFSNRELVTLCPDAEFGRDKSLEIVTEQCTEDVQKVSCLYLSGGCHSVTNTERFFQGRNRTVMFHAAKAKNLSASDITNLWVCGDMPII